MNTLSEVYLTPSRKVVLTCCAEKNLSVLPLRVELDEVSKGSLGNCELVGLLDGLSPRELIWVTLTLSGYVSIDILASLLNIASNIKSITRGFWDSETVVKRDTSWDTSET